MDPNARSVARVRGLLEDDRACVRCPRTRRSRGRVAHLGSLALCAWLAACGGGGDPVTPSVATTPQTTDVPPGPTVAPMTCTPPPEGLWTGFWPNVIMGGTFAGGRADPSFIVVARGESTLLFYGPNLETTPRISGYVRTYGGTYSCSPVPRRARLATTASTTRPPWALGRPICLRLQPPEGRSR
jgi:hypothetical protein